MQKYVNYSILPVFFINKSVENHLPTHIFCPRGSFTTGVAPL